MNWYRKLTIEWPCRLGDWAWWALVVVPAEFLNALTFKRSVMFVGLLIFIYGFAQVFALDLAVMFATQAMAYFDVATAVLLVALRGHAREGLRATKTLITKAVSTLMMATRRRFPRHHRRQRRLRTALRRLFGKSSNSDEDPGLGVWGARALVA